MPAATPPVIPPPAPPVARADPMPLPMTGKAPRFSPDPIGFRLFFDSVKELADRAQLSDEKAIEWAVRYAGSHGLGWDRVDAFRNKGSWADFRAQVLRSYPGLNDESRFTLHDLDSLVDRTHRTEWMTSESYGEYQRSFAACAGFLQDKGRLSAREASRSFLRGFPHHIHTAVINRLAIRRPDVLPDEGYVISDIEEAALYVLRSRDLAYRGRSDQTRSDRDRPSDRRRAEEDRSSAAASMEELTKAMASLTQILAANAQMQAIPPPPALAPLPPRRPQVPAPGGAVQYAPRWPQRPQGHLQQTAPVRTCLFCGEPGHFVGECPVAQEYLIAGKIIRNEEWKLVLPDNRHIPRHVPGGTMREKIDNFYRNQQIPERSNEAQRDVISANFLEGIDESIFAIEITPVSSNLSLTAATLPSIVANLPTEAGPSSSSSSSSPPLSDDADLAEQIQIMEAQIESLRQSQVLALAKKPERFDGVHVPARRDNPPARDTVPAARVEKTPNVHAQAVSRILMNPDRHPAVARPSRKEEKQPESRPQGPIKPVDFPAKPPQEEPKYHYKAPVEASVKTREIVDRALDATITVSTRELLATSPEARRQFKDIVGNKKVSANVAEMEAVDTFLTSFTSSYSLDDDLRKYRENASAAHSLPLRVIYPTFAPGFMPECILDGGAQVVIVRRDVWERLHVPLSTDKRMKMESANAGTTLTIGVVENHPVMLGPVTVYLQLQVVEDAPFEVLLGRPFFDVTSCSEISEQGGKHVLVVKNPRGGDNYLIATYPRFHKTPRLNFLG